MSNPSLLRFTPSFSSVISHHLLHRGATHSRPPPPFFIYSTTYTTNALPRGFALPLSSSKTALPREIAKICPAVFREEPALGSAGRHVVNACGVTPRLDTPVEAERQFRPAPRFVVRQIGSPAARRWRSRAPIQEPLTSRVFRKWRGRETARRNRICPAPFVNPARKHAALDQISSVLRPRSVAGPLDFLLQIFRFIRRKEGGRFGKQIPWDLGEPQ